MLNRLDPGQARHFVGLIWVQSVSKGYEQTSLVGNELNDLELPFPGLFSRYFDFDFFGVLCVLCITATDCRRSNLVPPLDPSNNRLETESIISINVRWVGSILTLVYGYKQGFVVCKCYWKPLNGYFANSDYPDEMPLSAAFHQSLHCLLR